MTNTIEVEKKITINLIAPNIKELEKKINKKMACKKCGEEELKMGDNLCGVCGEPLEELKKEENKNGKQIS